MITYVKGDATLPQAQHDNEQCYIVHCCNNLGAWGSGFVVAVSKRWRKPETNYRNWALTGNDLGSDFKLGEIQYVRVEPNIVVVNMIAQHGVGISGSNIPLRYGALYRCLNDVAMGIITDTKDVPYSIHMPRIGCGLAGGDWTQVEDIIERTLVELEIPVTVYDLP